MSLSQLKIPKKIVVGYQERKDTYSGKLAYVTYIDEKGTLRKEASWDGWRDKKIESDQYDNLPTSGFVLNKNVGETRWGWNPRKAWVRIYDPRGFEFEISVANLLFILEECTSIKGKGLEGEFVYSLDGADLVLLPVCSQEYVSSSDYTNLQTKKVNKTDMTEGCWYKNKSDEKVMYLGRVDYHEPEGYYSYEHLERSSSGVDRARNFFLTKSKKVHVFVKDGKSGYGKYWIQKGFTNLAEKLTDKADEQYSIEYDSYIASMVGTPPCKIAVTNTNIEWDDISDNFYSHHNSAKLYLRESGIIYGCTAVNNGNVVDLMKRSILEYDDNGVSMKKELVSWHDTYGSVRGEYSEKAVQNTISITQNDFVNYEFVEFNLENKYGTLQPL